MAASEDDDRPMTKVGRLIEEYDLGAEYGATMEAAWTGEGTERTSLRDLADRFNRDLLEAALADAGVPPLERDIDATYGLLTEDGTTAAARTEARRRLADDGVDVERLEGNFVTYQAIRSYLQDVRGADYERDDADVTERTAESIGRLRTRLERVTESNLARLADGDRLTLGEFRLFVSADVLCEECGAQYAVEELLERGGCDCAADD